MPFHSLPTAHSLPTHCPFPPFQNLEKEAAKEISEVPAKKLVSSTAVVVPEDPSTTDEPAATTCGYYTEEFLRARSRDRNNNNGEQVNSTTCQHSQHYPFYRPNSYLFIHCPLPTHCPLIARLPHFRTLRRRLPRRYRRTLPRSWLVPLLQKSLRTLQPLMRDLRIS